MTTHQAGSPLEFTARLPFGTLSARTARQMVADLMARQELSGRVVEDALLVVHELVVNGVTHGQPDSHQEIEIFCCLSATELFISVLDQGEGGSVGVQPMSRSHTSGRGLTIVAALSRSWTVDRSHGTRVSATLAV